MEGALIESKDETNSVSAQRAVTEEIVEQLTKLMNMVQFSHGVMTWENAPSVLNVSQAAKLLQIGESKMYTMCNIEDFPLIRFGKSFRIPTELLRQWVAEKALAREIVEE